MKSLSNGNIYPTQMPTRPSRMVSSGTLLIPVCSNTQPRMALDPDMISQILMPYSQEATSEITWSCSRNNNRCRWNL